MNVGDYVRTKKQGIKRIDKIFENATVNKYGFKDKKNDYEYFVIRTDEIIKSSPQIIDLIEVGDLMYIDISPDNCDGIIVPRIAETENELNKYKEKINSGEYILKAIITHEQLENEVYRVEE